ncbi:MAG: fused MFS/spermidine synthase [Candidatus Anammoxibacter sp.]
MQNSIKTLVLFLFFLSGVCGLIYEVVWIRMFGLVLGNTTYAISITIAAFFAGLALGGFCLGRYVDSIRVGSYQLAVGKGQKRENNANGRHGQASFVRVQAKENRKIIQLYAYLELGIGASALFVGLGIVLMQSLFIWVTQYIQYSSIIIDLMRFVLSFSLLLIPTTLMGATLPVLSKFIIRQYKEIRSGVGLLYGVNTFGAALGCLITGFFLIKTYGVSTTVHIAVITNIAIGILVLILVQTGFFCKTEGKGQLAVGSLQLAKNKKQNAEGGKRKNGEDSKRKSDRAAMVVLLVIGLSGFTSIAYEIIWTRMLSSLFLNSIYSFTTMLVTFLCGLAIGAIVVMLFFKKDRNPLTLLGLVEFGIGISAVLLIFLFNQLPETSLRFLSFFQSKNPLTWNINVCVEFALSFMVMIVPCILIGMTLPLASQIITKDIKLLGRSVGNIYSITTIGGMFGAAIAGCLLIPLIGLKFSELSMAGLNMCIGVAFLFYAGKYLKVGQTQGIFLKKIAIPLFCVITVTIGGFCSFADIRVWDSSNELLYYEEDAAATVSVVKEKDGNRKLVVNKRYTLGTSRATALQKRMGYIPLLLHNNPQDVLVIGLGTGITLGAVASYELTKTVTCVEVISAVVYAAKKYFAKENNMFYKNKKTNIIVEDGRNYLLLNKDKYDVIISDLFVPYHAGAGSLYSKEHFELCKDRIHDTGLFCQWLPLYQMSTKEFKVICKTLSTVFPFTTLWFCNFEKGLICGLVGTKHKLEIDVPSLKDNMANANTRKQLKQAILGGHEELLSLFITDETGLKSFTKGSRINTDNYPVIEFLAPKNIFGVLQKAEDRGQKTNSNMQVAQARKTSFQLVHESGWKPDLRALPVKTKYTHLGLSNLAIVAGLKKDVSSILPYSYNSKNLGYYSDAISHLISGMLYFYNDMLADAEDEYLTAWELAPDHLYMRKMFQDLSVKFYRMGNYDETIFINKKLVDARQEIIDPYLYFYLGLAYQAKGYLDNAINSYNNALALNPNNSASIHYNLGIIYKNLGAMDNASTEFETAERLKVNAPY